VSQNAPGTAVENVSYRRLGVTPPTRQTLPAAALALLGRLLRELELVGSMSGVGFRLT
jgi:hypothetical protein